VPGWDAATGLGSPNFQLIANYVVNISTFYSVTSSPGGGVPTVNTPSPSTAPSDSPPASAPTDDSKRHGITDDDYSFALKIAVCSLAASIASLVVALSVVCACFLGARTPGTISTFPSSANLLSRRESDFAVPRGGNGPSGYSAVELNQR
jgi:hypothetical protein